MKIIKVVLCEDNKKLFSETIKGNVYILYTKIYKLYINYIIIYNIMFIIYKQDSIFIRESYDKFLSIFPFHH